MLSGSGEFVNSHPLHISIKSARSASRLSFIPSRFMLNDVPHSTAAINTNITATESGSPSLRKCDQNISCELPAFTSGTLIYPSSIS